MTTASVTTVPSFERASFSPLRKLVTFLAILALWLAGTIATAPPASAHYCGHDSHFHNHGDHNDWEHWHSHYNEFGMHFHTWHNHTHSYTFSTEC